MKVYLDENGESRLVGLADVPEGAGPVFRAPMFGAASIVLEPFVVGAVTHLPASGGAPVMELAVLASPGQLVEFCRGGRRWRPSISRSTSDTCV